MEITMDEAIKTIINYPDNEDFICWKVQYYMYGGEPTDNSFELAQYWDICKSMVLKGER